MAVADSWTTFYVNGVYANSSEQPYFTYLTEFGDRSQVTIAIEVTLLTVIFLTSVAANLVVMICILRYSDVKTVTNCFILNLTAADLVLALTIPEVAVTRVTGTWKLGNVTCKIVPYLQLIAGAVLLWTLAFISIDRYRCIVVPPYRSPLTPLQSGLLSLLLWLTASILLLPVSFHFQLELNQICTLPTRSYHALSYSLCISLFGLLLPIAILVWYHQEIFRKILRTRATWASGCVATGIVPDVGGRGARRRPSELSVSDIFVPWPGGRKCSLQLPAMKNRSGSLSHQEEIRINRHVKAVRLLLLNVVLVVVTWLPLTLLLPLLLVDGFLLKSYHLLGCLCLAYGSTIVNPVLYGLVSDNFKGKLWKWGWWGRGQEDGVGIVKENVTPSSQRMQVRKMSLAGSVSGGDGPNCFGEGVV